MNTNKFYTAFVYNHFSRREKGYYFRNVKPVQLISTEKKRFVKQ